MVAWEFDVLGISVLSVGIALHTKLQNRKKKELGELASKLEDVADTLDGVLAYYQSPRSNEDTYFGLGKIEKDILACNHQSDNPPVVVPHLKFRENDGEAIDIDDLNDIPPEKLYKLYIDVEIKDGEEVVYEISRWQISIPVRRTSYGIQSLIDINQNHEGLIDDFDKNLTDDSLELLNDFNRKLISHLVSLDGFFVYPSTFEHAEDIGDYAFDKIFRYDGIDEDLEAFREFEERIEELRTTVLQAKYS